MQNCHDSYALLRQFITGYDHLVSTHRIAQRSRRYLSAFGEAWRLDD